MRRLSSRSRTQPLYAVVPALLACLAAPAFGQRVLGLGEDAVGVPKGAFRIAIESRWLHFNERFSAGTATTPAGNLASLGAAFRRDVIGAADVEILSPVQTTLRTLADIPNLAVSLGTSRATIDASSVTTPISVEYGVSSRITVGVLLPYVRTRSEVVLDVNPTFGQANVGLNPALSGAAGSATARSENGRVLAQLRAAAERLQTELDRCEANPTQGSCPALNAQRQAALALIAASNTFATGVERVYGTATAAGSPFVPLDGSVAQVAIGGRLAAFNTSYRTFLQLPASDADPIAARPYAARARAALGDMQRVLQDPEFLIAAAPLETVERSHIGDVEVGAKFVLFDSFGSGTRRRVTARGVNLRSAVSVIYRFGTGQSDKPNDFTDIGTGDGQNDVELRSATDVMVSRRLWGTVAARYGVQQADRQFVRVPNLDLGLFPSAVRLMKAERDLGDYLTLEITPRLVLNDFFAISAQYLYRRQGEDEYSGSSVVEDPALGTLTLDAGLLSTRGTMTEQRVGGGVSYSTLAAFDRGQARLPLELLLSHFQTIAGRGNQAKSFITQLQLRYYHRLRGR